MLDLNLNVASNHDSDSSMVVEKFLKGLGNQMEESGTSNSSVVNADDGSCSKRAAGEMFTFSFDILKAGGESDTMKESAWIDYMSFSNSNENQAVHGGGGEVRVTQHESQPAKKGRRGPRSRSSEYRGVTFYRRTGRWESHIWDCGKQVYLGGFDTSHAAARVYDRAAIRFRGVGADINFSLSDYEEELTQMKHMSKEEFVHILRRQSTGFSRGGSRYRGVTLHRCGRWEARMGQFLGKKAYDKAAMNCNGREAVTNFEASTYQGETRKCNEVREDGLDLNLGISPPSLGNNPKEVELSLWNNSASFDLHTSQSLKEMNQAASMASDPPSTRLAMTSEHSPSWNGIYPDFFSNYKRTRRW